MKSCIGLNDKNLSEKKYGLFYGWFTWLSLSANSTVISTVIKQNESEVENTCYWFQINFILQTYVDKILNQTLMTYNIRVHKQHQLIMYLRQVSGINIETSNMSIHFPTDSIWLYHINCSRDFKMMHKRQTTILPHEVKMQYLHFRSHELLLSFVLENSWSD